MRYAKVIDGVVVEYPVMPTDIIRANQNMSFPHGELPHSVMEHMGLTCVNETALPAFDATTHTIDEGQPVFSGSQWEQTWIVRDLTADELVAKSVVT